MKRNVSLAVLVVVFAVSGAAVAQISMPSMENSITVISSGEVQAAPDLCRVEFSMEMTGDSLEQLAIQMEQWIAGAKATLESVDVPGLKVDVSGMTYSQAGGDLQQMFGNLGGEAPTGYSVKATIVAGFGIKGMKAAEVMRNMDAVIDASVEAEIALSKFGFAVTDEEELARQALKKAVENSAAEAQSIAAAAGKQIIGAASFMVFDMSEMMGSMFGGAGTPMKNIMDAMFTGGALSDNPESVVVTASIFVTYKIK